METYCRSLVKGSCILWSLSSMVRKHHKPITTVEAETLETGVFIVLFQHIFQ